MTRRKTTKVRAYEEDNEILKLLALKISAKLEKITTTAEVLSAIIEEVKQKRADSIEQISAKLSDRIKSNL
jgi:DNA polymerase III delta prime subunit